MFPFPRLLRPKKADDNPPEPGLHDEYIALASSNNFKLLARDGDVFTELDLITANVSWQTAWHPTKSICVVALNASPFLVGYDLSTGVPVSIDLGANLPTTICRSIRWSPDGKYLAIGFNGVSPHFHIRQYVGGVFTKLADPASLLGTATRGIAWTADSATVTFAKTSASNPCYRTYSVDGTTVTALGGFGGNTTAFQVDIARDADETIIGGDGLSPYARAFEFDPGRTTATLTGVNPTKADASAATGVAWNKDGTLLAVVTAGGCTINSWDGSAFTLLDTITATSLTEASWTGNDILMVGRSSAPWIYLRKVVAGVVSSPTVDTGIFNGNIRQPKGSLVP